MYLAFYEVSHKNIQLAEEINVQNFDVGDDDDTREKLVDRIIKLI